MLLVVLERDWFRKVIGNIFRKSLRLSGRVRADAYKAHSSYFINISHQARLEHNAGKITTMISTDTTRLDFAATMIHMYVLVKLMGPLLTILAGFGYLPSWYFKRSRRIPLRLISQIDFRRNWSPR